VDFRSGPIVDFYLLHYSNKWNIVYHSPQFLVKYQQRKLRKVRQYMYSKVATSVVAIKITFKSPKAEG